jgi:hypothetical protein
VAGDALITRGGPKVPTDMVKKAQKHSVIGVGWEAIDPQLDASLVSAVRDAAIVANRLRVHVMRDPSWGHHTAAEVDAGQRGWLEPDELAAMLSSDLVAVGSTAKQCTAVADIEAHDPAYVLAWLRAWRRIRPHRVTVWTLEPFQGGWITPALATAINNDVNLTVAHQNYLGNPRMYPAAADEVRSDLIGAGIHSSRLRGYYDGELELPAGWAGIVYNFGALPYP